jgi:hypothetical protein
MARVTIAVLCALTLIALACGKRDTYRPVYYPDKGDLTIYTRGPAFDNLAQARQWAQDQQKQRRDPDWDYEVGKNCRPLRADSDIEVCEETLR